MWLARRSLSFFPQPNRVRRYFSQNPHLGLAHSIVENILRPGDHAIDATCGNGWDSVFLARQILTPSTGFLYGIDIQKTALEKTELRLQKELDKERFARVQLFLQSHEKFPPSIPPGSISVVMYNLGYLPGGDKTVITTPQSTVGSVFSALPLIRRGGVITILCYRGHQGGNDETTFLLSNLTKLDPREWKVDILSLHADPSSSLLISLSRLKLALGQ